MIGIMGFFFYRGSLVYIYLASVPALSVEIPKNFKKDSYIKYVTVTPIQVKKLMSQNQSQHYTCSLDATPQNIRDIEMCSSCLLWWKDMDWLNFHGVDMWHCALG